MVSQLRIYTIESGRMEEWVEAWTQSVYPLRLKHGFAIPGAWVVEGQNKFVWIVSYDGPETWEAKEEAYYGSSDRRALDPDPAQYLMKTESWFITSVLP